LWRTDGTAAGTVRVADLTPGPGGSDLSRIVPAGGAGYFFVYGLTSAVLWTTDGTAAGTLPLREFARPTNPGFEFPTGALAGGRFVFCAFDPALGSEPWVTDGTPAGTVLLKDMAPGAASSSPAQFTALGDRVVFAAMDAGVPPDVWVTNGTPAGTAKLHDFTPAGVGTSNFRLDDFTPYNGRVYFRAVYDPPPLGEGPGNGHTEVWSTDGTPGGTGLFIQAGQHANYTFGTGAMAVIDGLLYYTASGDVQLWRTNGTAAGAEPVAFVDGPVSQMTGAGGRVYFIQGTEGSSRKLYSADGEFGEPIVLLAGSPWHLTAVGDAVFVVAYDGVWTADAQGARLVKSLTDGTADAYPGDFLASGGLLTSRGRPTSPPPAPGASRTSGWARATTIAPTRLHLRSPPGRSGRLGSGAGAAVGRSATGWRGGRDGPRHLRMARRPDPQRLAARPRPARGPCGGRRRRRLHLR
jgi:ELWxxDGT repeat protein